MDGHPASNRVINMWVRFLPAAPTLIEWMIVMNVDSLRSYIRLVLEDTDGSFLSDGVIRKLISLYASKPGGQPDLNWHHVSFSASSKRGPWGNVGGMYVPEDVTLLINSDTRGDMRKKVRDVLHEIAHYNQHMAWNEDDKARFAWVKGRGLPPGRDSYDVYDISYEEIARFWRSKYGYRDAPHEVEARTFADANLRAAMDAIADVIQVAA